MAIIFNVTKVRELMTPGPILIGPEETLAQAAKKMAAINCGVLPVGTEHDLKGMITDRDIVIRAIAHEKNPAQAKVKDFMSTEVFDCHEDDSIETAAATMQQHNVGRLIVRNSRGTVTGIISFGRIIRNDANPHEFAEIIRHAAGPVSV